MIVSLATRPHGPGACQAPKTVKYLPFVPGPVNRFYCYDSMGNSTNVSNFPIEEDLMLTIGLSTFMVNACVGSLADIPGITKVCGVCTHVRKERDSHGLNPRPMSGSRVAVIAGDPFKFEAEYLRRLDDEDPLLHIHVVRLDSGHIIKFTETDSIIHEIDRA